MQSLDRTLGARELRALAHPLRQRLLEELTGSSATATMLARRLGESSGATSYHLRELQKAGFVEEDPERGNKRDRWWRRATRPFLVPTDPPADDAEYEAALAQLGAVIVERDEGALARYFASIANEPGEWREASFLGGWDVFATPEEIHRFSAVLLEELLKLRRGEGDRPAGARQVHVTYRALVQPEAEEN